MEILIQAKSLDAMTGFYTNVRHCQQILNLGTQLTDNLQVFATEDHLQLTTDQPYSEQLCAVMQDLIPNDDVFIQIKAGEDHTLLGYGFQLTTESEDPQFISIAEIEELIQTNSPYTMDLGTYFEADDMYDFEVEEAPLISNQDFTPTALEADVKCPVCLGEYNHMQRTVCGHMFCDVCTQSLINYQHNVCPMCRADLLS